MEALGSAVPNAELTATLGWGGYGRPDLWRERRELRLHWAEERLTRARVSALDRLTVRVPQISQVRRGAGECEPPEARALGVLRRWAQTTNGDVFCRSRRLSELPFAQHGGALEVSASWEIASAWRTLEVRAFALRAGHFVKVWTLRTSYADVAALAVSCEAMAELA